MKGEDLAGESTIEKSGDQIKEHYRSASIAESLDLVLGSSRFRNAAVLQTLLKYIVEKSIHGEHDALKERIIGMVVFGRKPDFDTSSDPIVRSRVGLLRKRLVQFYESEESRDCVVEITIPSRAYSAIFLMLPENTRETERNHVTVEPARSAPFIEALEDSSSILPITNRRIQGKDRRRNVGLVGLLCCGVFLVASMVVAHLRKSELGSSGNHFWTPKKR